MGMWIRSQHMKTEFSTSTLNWHPWVCRFIVLTQTMKQATYFIDLFEDIIKDYKEKKRMVDVNEVGIYKRINRFLHSYYSDSTNQPKVVDDALTLDHYGLAREMSLPPDGNTFNNEYISSYRIKQGVLHNPRNDRRTTEGSFHLVEGGLAIPFDKKAVPKEAFARLYKAAIHPPEELKMLPFTINQDEKTRTFVSLMIKPIVFSESSGSAGRKKNGSPLCCTR